MKYTSILASLLAAVLGGSMIFPTAAAAEPEISGDVNADGTFDLADIVALQKWLLQNDTALADWKAGNFDTSNENLDGVDLCLMRQALLQKTNNGKTILVSSVDELRQALKTVSAGDTILLESGTYEWGTKGTAGSLFMSAASGTADAPITLKSKDPQNPAVLKGSDFSDGMVLYLTGDHWNVSDLVICNAKKGIMLDNSNYTKIQNVSVHHIGEEGIHLRDGSSDCQIIHADVHDCGLLTANRGEGIYIGSAKTTTGYDYACDRNRIQDCNIGPNITAECVDIKEYTTGNIIENCTMHGSGMTATDSLIDVKGNAVQIQNNIFYDDGNSAITDAIQLHCQAEGWDCENVISGNTANLSGETAYVVRSWSGTSCTVKENIRNPESDTYLYRAYQGSTMTIL